MKVELAPCLVVPKEALGLFHDSGCLGESILHGDLEEHPVPYTQRKLSIHDRVQRKRERLLRRRQQERKRPLPCKTAAMPSLRAP